MMKKPIHWLRRLRFKLGGLEADDVIDYLNAGAPSATSPFIVFRLVGGVLQMEPKVSLFDPEAQHWVALGRPLCGHDRWIRADDYGWLMERAKRRAFFRALATSGEGTPAIALRCGPPNLEGEFVVGRVTGGGLHVQGTSRYDPPSDDWPDLQRRREPLDHWAVASEWASSAASDHDAWRALPLPRWVHRYDESMLLMGAALVAAVMTSLTSVRADPKAVQVLRVILALDMIWAVAVARSARAKGVLLQSAKVSASESVASASLALIAFVLSLLSLVGLILPDGA